jgi:hypothetical protein
MHDRQNPNCPLQKPVSSGKALFHIMNSPSWSRHTSWDDITTGISQSWIHAQIEQDSSRECIFGPAEFFVLDSPCSFDLDPPCSLPFALLPSSSPGRERQTATELKLNIGNAGCFLSILLTFTTSTRLCSIVLNSALNILIVTFSRTDQYH